METRLPGEDSILRAIASFRGGNTKLSPSDKQQVITLQIPLKITGDVTDAQTGEPIESFSVLHGISFGDGQQVSWQSNVARQGKNGKYEFVLSYPRPGHHLRFDAIGYESKVSRKFTDDEGAVTFDVKLRPTTPVEGIVVDASGKPVANAYVVINTPGERAAVENGRIGDSRDVTYATTNEAGRFELPSRGDEAAIVVLHDLGMKMIKCAEIGGGKLELIPWATVKGTATRKNEAVKQEQVRYYHHVGEETQFIFSGATTTDDKGEFTLNRVPPDTDLTITLQKKDGGGVLASSVETKSGKVTTADLDD